MDISSLAPRLLHALAFLAWVPLVAIIHELGHAIAAARAGFRLTSFGIGRGPTALRLRMPGNVVFHIGWVFFTGGACVAIPRSPELGPRAALFHGGGIAAQIVLGLLLLAVPSGPWSTWVDAGGQFNLLVAIWNLIPWRWGRVASDGWWLFSRLTLGTMAPQRALFEQRQSIEQVLAHETRIRSPVGIWYGHLMLAWCDLLTGRTASAHERLQQSAVLATAEPQLAGIEALVRAEAALRTERPMVALRIVEDARSALSEAHEIADLLTLVEARSWLAFGDVIKARRALGHLAGLGGPIGREAMSASLAVAVVDADRSAVCSTANRLARDSTRGMFDPMSASRTLHAACELAPDPASSARWQARAIGMARAAVHRASSEDKPALQGMLAEMLNTNGGFAAPRPAPAMESLPVKR